MKDIFTQYKKHNFATHAGILSISIFFALWINFLFNSDFNASSLKANTLEITQEAAWQENQADIYPTINNSVITIKNNRVMEEVSEIALSFSYDPEILSIEIPSTLNDIVSITTLENTPWFTTVIMKYLSPQNIETQTELLKFKYTLSQDKTTQLNLINTNFSDIDWKKYLLSSQWVIF